MEGYTDSDMAGNLDRRKSTLGFLFTFARGPILWQFKLQKCITLTTKEAEYIATAKARKDILWVKRFFQELGIR